MDVSTRIEELFEKEAYLIDILPKTVSRDGTVFQCGGILPQPQVRT